MAMFYPVPAPTPELVTKNPQKEVTATRKDCKTAKSAPKFTVGPKQAPVAKCSKSAKPKQPSQPKELVAPIQSNQSPLDVITDLLDNLPLHTCGAHSQTPHIRPIPPLWPRSLTGCAQNRSPFCRRIWQRSLGRRCRLKPCGWPAEMPTESAAGRRNLNISLVNTG